MLGLLAAAAVLPAALAQCDAGWTTHTDGNTCLKVLGTLQTWADGAAACQAETPSGSDIASIHDAALNMQVKSMCAMINPCIEGCWIGATDAGARARNFRWVDGTAWDFTVWRDHGGGNMEPNNDFCSNRLHGCTYGSFADCVEIIPSTNGPWQDTFCSHTKKTVCAYSITRRLSPEKSRPPPKPVAQDIPKPIAPPPGPAPPVDVGVTATEADDAEPEVTPPPTGP